MARKLDSFAPELLRATELALSKVETTDRATGALLRFSAPSAGASARIQMEFRMFWQTIRKMADNGTLDPLGPHARLAPHVHLLAARYGPKKTVVEIIHRSQTMVARAISEALGGLSEAMELASVESPEPARFAQAVPRHAGHPASVAAATGPGANATLEDIYGVGTQLNGNK